MTEKSTVVTAQQLPHSKDTFVADFEAEMLTAKTYQSHTLREERGHSFVLPQCDKCDSNLFRFSFLIGCLFRFV